VGAPLRPALTDRVSLSRQRAKRDARFFGVFSKSHGKTTLSARFQKDTLTDCFFDFRNKPSIAKKAGIYHCKPEKYRFFLKITKTPLEKEK
jgi:hypothetical protein